MLGYAYWIVTAEVRTLDLAIKLLKPIILGIVSTILIFWSLSGFILKIIQMMKNIYFKETNMFILRQLNNKINTTVISMSVICLMLFMTITILSSSISLRNAMNKDLNEMTPVDINIYKNANLPDYYTKKNGEKVLYTKEQIEESKKTVSETLKNNNFDMNLLKDVIEINLYSTNELTWEKFFESKIEEVKLKFPMLEYSKAEQIIKISDYNKIAKIYGLQEYSLNEDEYIMICDFDSIKSIRDIILKEGNNELEIAGKKYKSKYNQCEKGFVYMSTSHMNTGIILVPDSCNLKKENIEQYMLIANYNAETKQEKEEIEKQFSNDEDKGIIDKLANQGVKIDGMTKIVIIESSIGIATIVTFISIYLGIIFLIASSAILALKQLTESADNKQRYSILRRIGCDEKMINKTLFWQIGIFFATPLILSIIHSIFGIQFVMIILEGLTNKNELLPSIIITTVVLSAVYGAYFIATYLGSKNIIRSDSQN